MVRGKPDVSFFLVREEALFYIEDDDDPVGKLAAEPVLPPTSMFDNVACSSVLIPPVGSQILASDSLPQSRPSDADPHRVAAPQQRADHIPALMSLSPQLRIHRLLDGRLPPWIRAGHRIGSGRSADRHTSSSNSASLASIKSLMEEVRLNDERMQLILKSCQASRVPPPVEKSESDYIERFVVVRSIPQTEPQVVQPTPPAPSTLPVPVATVPSPDPVPMLRRSSRQVQQIRTLNSESSVATMTTPPV